jgi:molecular chaperone IbpA
VLRVGGLFNNLAQLGGNMVIARNFPNYREDMERVLNFTVGFDSMIDRLFGDVSTTHHSVNSSGGFPPYNVRKDKNEYIIEMAVAGFSKNDLGVHVEDGVLSVSTKNEKKDVSPEDSYVYRGIAERSFKRSWTLSDDVVVKHADLIDGMLTISLEKIVPEEKRPREIPISTRTIETKSKVLEA